MERFTEEEAKRIAIAIYRTGRPLSCPRDGGDIKHQMNPMTGTSAKDLFFSCERCGTTGDFTPSVAPKEDNWTLSEMKAVIEDYWKTKRPHCSKDGAILRCTPIDENGPARFLISCSLCGRSFDSGTLPKAEA
jgi:hypothetical protein